jgi:signal transduction histidine kinase
MLIRRQALLLFFLCGWLPAVGLACVVFGFWEHDRKVQLEERTRDEAAQTARRLQAALITRERQLKLLATDARLIGDLARNEVPVRDITPGQELPSRSGDPVVNYWAMNGGDLYAVYGFDADGQPVFIAETVPGPDGVFTTKRANSIPQVSLDRTLWAKVLKGIAFGTMVRDGVARHYVPVKVPTGWALLVADFLIDGLLRETLAPDEPLSDAEYRLVLDQRGLVLNELPRAIRYQPISSTFPGWASKTAGLSADSPGSELILDRGLPYFEAHHPVGSLGLSVVVMRRQEGFGGRAWWFFLAALALITILFLGFLRWHQTALRRDHLAIAKVTQSAADIAAGKITRPVEIVAGPELQELAANFNRMIEKLREQMAREAEARQFQAFMRLSATITHDLKNAIQALSLLVSNLEAHFDDPEFRAHAVQGLTRSTETLNALIARLSEPMRSLSGELPRPQPTDLVAMLRRVLRATAEHDRHQLIVVLPDKLIAEVDAERVEKVFENLIINALQAMDKQQGTLTVSATSDAETCTISVSDTGVGMTDEYLRDKLFRAFATTKPLGIGLGLYTCREVIRAHGGSIDVKSERGSGTTFNVVLPLRAQSFWATSTG